MWGDVFPRCGDLYGGRHVKNSITRTKSLGRIANKMGFVARRDFLIYIHSYHSIQREPGKCITGIYNP
jgi:hypothetical protein